MQKRSWPDTAAPDNSAELVFPLFFGFLVCKITSFCSFSQSNFQAQWATFFFPRHKAVKSSQFTEVQQPKRENVVIKKNWKFSWDQTQSSKQSVGHKETAVYAEKRFCCSDFSHFKWKYLRQTHVLPSHYTFGVWLKTEEGVIFIMSLPAEGGSCSVAQHTVVLTHLYVTSTY